MLDTRIVKGFTIVEILITIAIITIMTAVGIGTWSFGRQYDQMQNETARLASLIRTMRIRSVNAVAFDARMCLDGITLVACPSQLCKNLDLACVSICSLGTCSTHATMTCSDEFDCPQPDTCIFVTCVENASCGSKGVCAMERYPVGGYGVHLTSSSVMTFGDRNGGLMPAYDTSAGVPNPELIENRPIPSSLKLVLPAGTESEIVFLNSAGYVYSKTSDWNEEISLNTYTIQVLANDGSCVKGKRGEVTIDLRTMQVDSVLVAC